MSATSLEHAGQDGARQPERADQIGRDDALEVVLRKVDETAERPGPRVVHEDVGVTFGGSCTRQAHLLGVGQVGHDHMAPNGASHLVEPPTIAPEHGDVGSQGAELQGGRTSDAARATGDEDRGSGDTHAEHDGRMSPMLTTLDGVTDHQVLQRNASGTARVTISGRATQPVHISVLTEDGRPFAGPQPVTGAWSLSLDLPTGGPYRVEAQDAKGATDTLAVGVLVGDLWVLAGQSNMAGAGRMIDVEKPTPAWTCSTWDAHGVRPKSRCTCSSTPRIRSTPTPYLPRHASSFTRS